MNQLASPGIWESTFSKSTLAVSLISQVGGPLYPNQRHPLQPIIPAGTESPRVTLTKCR